MSPKPVKILIHLHRPPLPVDGGDKQRLMGMLNYFRSRDWAIADGFGGNTAGRVEWTDRDLLDLQPYIDRFELYRGETNLVDFIYSRSKSFYYQTVLRQQLPIDTDYFAPPGYVRFVKKLIKHGQYDYLWLNYLEYAALAIHLKASSDIKIIIDIHDLACRGRLVMNDLEYLQKLQFDYQQNLIKEGKLLDKFDRVIVNSEEEMEILQNYLPPEKLLLIPHPISDRLNSPEIVPYNRRKFDYDLLFVGTGRDPNLKAMNFFLEEIFPSIVAQKPDTTLALVGSIDRVITIRPQLSKNVLKLGYVRELTTVYCRTKIIICPLLKGAGTKVKLQEALAYAIPIVTTTIGASGLRLRNDVNAYITDDPQLFATRVLTLLEREQLCQQFSAAAQLTFQQHYANEIIYKRLDRLFAI
jgi:glycosyltransferase involved in cell wall biosynthesis